MSELFVAMMLVLLSWFCLILIFVGIGLFLCRAFGLRIQRVDSLFASFWSGWALASPVPYRWKSAFDLGSDRDDWISLELEKHVAFS